MRRREDALPRQTSPVSSNGTERRLAFLAGLTTIVLLAMVWTLPRPIGDVFVALAGGRDVLAGRLGAPDDWASTTAGRVWVNQNWGSDVLFYVAHAAFGEAGLLGLKALLLAGIAATTWFACRTRAVSETLSLLLPGAAVAAAWSYLDLRPNLLSLLLAPLVLALLERPREEWRSLAGATMVVCLWANLHGGFLVGVVLLALRAGSLLVAYALGAGIRSGAARAAPPAIASLLAVVGAALFSPFGLANLTHPFTVAASPVWRRVNEWVPLLPLGSTSFGSVREWFIVLGLLVGVTCARFFLGRRSGHARPPSSPESLARGLFVLSVTVFVIAMAFGARRFVPLAILLLAPTLGRQLDLVLDELRARWAIAFLAVALLLPPVRLAAPLYARYQADSPLFPRESIFSRMVGRDQLAPGVVEFARANGLAGPVFNAWTWEGYLRWHVVELRPFIGGRAQQVYTAETLQLWSAIASAESGAAAKLADLGVPLVMVPLVARYAPLVRTLVHEERARFAWIYYDGRRAVLADAYAPTTRSLVRRAAQGELVYPDPGTATASRALALASPVVGADPEVILDGLVKASQVFPASEIYVALGTLAGPLDRAAILNLLGAEASRLGADNIERDIERPGGLRLLEARRTLHSTAARLASTAGLDDEAARQADSARRIAEEIRDLLRRWGYGDPPGNL